MRKHRRLSYLLGWAPDAGHMLGVSCTAFQRNGSVITGGRDGTVRTWHGGELRDTKEEHADAVNDLVVSPLSDPSGTDCFVSASSDSVVLFYTPNAPVMELCNHRDGAKKVRFTPDGLRLTSAGLDGFLYHYSIGEDIKITAKSDCGAALFSLATHPTVPLVSYAGTATGHILRTDWREKSSSAAAPVVKDAHKGAVRDMLAHGLELVTCSTNGAVKLWDLRSMRCSVVCHLHADAIFSLAMLGPSIVLSGSRDGTVAATNFATLETSSVVVSQYPIFHISVSPRQVLYVCTPRSSVDAFAVSSILPPEMLDDSGASPVGDTSSDAITPSKVSFSLGGSAAAVAPLHTSDGRSFASPFITPVVYASKVHQEKWCTPCASTHAATDRAATEPDFSIRGGKPALLQCTLLGDRAHVVCVDECDTVSVWSLLECKQKLTFPAGTTMKAAVEQSDSGLTVQSWCNVECRWGCLCVTLSHDDTFVANMNAWEWGMATSLGRRTISRAPRSTYTLSRAERTELKDQPLINLGVAAVKRLFGACRDGSHTDAASRDCVMQLVVWPIRLSPGEQEAATDTAPTPPMRVILGSLSLADVQRSVPSWIASVLSLGVPAPLPSGANVSVEVMPFQGTSLGAVPKAVLQVPRTLLIVDLLGEVSRQLKLGSKLPTLAAVAEGVRLASKGEVRLSPGDDLEVAGLSKPEEYLELVAADNTVVEPLLSIGAATYLYKEKSKGILRLWYRKNRFLSA